MCDITPVFVSQIENAMRKPSLETVCCIAKTLNTTVDELLNSQPFECDSSDIVRLLQKRTPEEITFSYRVLDEIFKNMENGEIHLKDI